MNAISGVKMDLNIQKIKEILKMKSLRITSSRLAVAEVLIDFKNTYLTSEEVHNKIINTKKIPCDIVSVYRILAKFEELEIVNRSEFNNDASRYILKNQSNNKSKHEHYFKCISCLKIEAFSDCFISKKEKELEAKGYKNLSHHLEILGTCPQCSFS